MTQITYVKSIQIPVNKTLSLYSISGDNFLVSSTFLDKKYLILPRFVSLSFFDQSLRVESSSIQEEKFNKFIFDLELWLKNINRPFRKKLLLKGLGYKVSISDNKRSLILKLGYSHLCTIEVPQKKISLKISKNTIIVEGFDPVEVGNFTSKIHRLKNPDSYKGKGIWHENEVKVLKEVKKK